MFKVIKSILNLFLLLPADYRLLHRAYVGGDPSLVSLHTSVLAPNWERFRCKESPETETAGKKVTRGYTFVYTSMGIHLITRGIVAIFAYTGVYIEVH